MNAIPKSQKEDSNAQLSSSDGVEESIKPLDLEINITEGGEFLDDAIRMKDQPFEETTEKGNE